MGIVFKCMASHTPTLKGRASSSPNLGFPFYLRVHTLSQNYTKFDVVTHVGRGLYLEDSHASHPKFVCLFLWGLKALSA